MVLTTDIITSVISSLRNDVNITAYVPSANIQAGWAYEIEQLPLITVVLIGDRNTGMLGFTHERIVEDTITLQIDIYGNFYSGAKYVSEISDLVTKNLLTSSISDVLYVRKIGDDQLFEPEYKMYRRVLRFDLYLHKSI